MIRSDNLKPKKYSVSDTKFNYKQFILMIFCGNINILFLNQQKQTKTNFQIFSNLVFFTLGSIANFELTKNHRALPLTSFNK